METDSTIYSRIAEDGGRWHTVLHFNALYGNNIQKCVIIQTIPQNISEGILLLLTLI